MITTGLYDRLIKPLRDQHIDQLIASMTTELWAPWDKELNFEERLVPMKQLESNTRSLAKDWINGLDKFPYVYVMNGNSEYINMIVSTSTGTIGWHLNDYSYYPHIAGQMKKNWVGMTEPGNVDDMVVSWPGYINGDSTELDFSRLCIAKRKHLDVAYLGLVKKIEMDADDFETVGISFSKTLSIPYNRISLVFSRKEIPTLSLLNRIGYVNLSGVNLANHMLKNLNINYWWNTYGGNALDELCLKHAVTPSNCILFGYSNKMRIGLAPLWRSS